MGIGSAKDERLAGERRINLAGQLSTHHLIKTLSDDVPVETLYFNVDFIRCLKQIRLLFVGAQHAHFFIDRPVNAFFTKLRGNAIWRFVIDQIAVDDRLSIRILISGCSENLCCMQCRSGGQANLDRIEVI